MKRGGKKGWTRSRGSNPGLERIGAGCPPWVGPACDWCWLLDLKEVRGAVAVADTFSRRAGFAQPALVKGGVGLVWAPGGQPRVVFGIKIARGKIVEIDLIADPEQVRQPDLAILSD